MQIWLFYDLSSNLALDVVEMYDLLLRMYSV